MKADLSGCVDREKHLGTHGKNVAGTKNIFSPIQQKLQSPFEKVTLFPHEDAVALRCDKTKKIIKKKFRAG